MKTLKVKCPAKINLTLEVLDKREDGYHNIKSIMQAVSLFDILTISVKEASDNSIILSGNSDKIPYNEKNLVYKAAMLFLNKTGIQNKEIRIYIEKNIPIEAGLAGGSSDAAGTFFGLNEVFHRPLDNNSLEGLCAELGSDLNFCLRGGTALCTSRGECIERLNTPKLQLSLIKPTTFGISAKEAYTKFSLLKNKSIPNNSEKMKLLLNEKTFDESLLYNSFESALLDDYEELKEMKTKIKDSMISGSGPTFFVLKPYISEDFDKEKFLKIENLETIEHGAFIVNNP